MTKQASTIDAARAQSDAIHAAALAFRSTDRLFQQGQAIAEVSRYITSPEDAARAIGEEVARIAVPPTQWKVADDGKGPQSYGEFVTLAGGPRGTYGISKSTVDHYRSSWSLMSDAGIPATPNTFADAHAITLAGKVKVGRTAAKRIATEPESTRVASFRVLSVALTGKGASEAEAKAAKAAEAAEARRAAKAEAEAHPVAAFLAAGDALRGTLAETAEAAQLGTLADGLAALLVTVQAAKAEAEAFRIGVAEAVAAVGAEGVAEAVAEVSAN